MVGDDGLGFWPGGMLPSRTNLEAGLARNAGAGVLLLSLLLVAEGGGVKGAMQTGSMRRNRRPEGPSVEHVVFLTQCGGNESRRLVNHVLIHTQ